MALFTIQHFLHDLQKHEAHPLGCHRRRVKRTQSPQMPFQEVALIAAAAAGFVQASDCVGLIFDSWRGQAAADPCVLAGDIHFCQASYF